MRSRQRIEISLLLCIASILLSNPVSAQVKPAGASAQLSAIVASGNLSDLRWSDFSDYRIHLTNFYRPSGYKLVWISDGQPTTQAIELIKLFQEADKKGLRPEDYDAPHWADRLASLKSPHQDDDEA